MLKNIICHGTDICRVAFVTFIRLLSVLLYQYDYIHNTKIDINMYRQKL